VFSLVTFFVTTKKVTRFSEAKNTIYKTKQKNEDKKKPGLFKPGL